MIVGEKFDAFIDNAAEVEFLEGTTAAGKTTVGIYKFMMEVAESPKKMHIISGLDTGTIEKNIINKDNGIMDEWGKLVDYNGNGTSNEKLPHIIFKPAPGIEKIIYVLGYDDKKRWKKALGGQYGCLYIDEINIADMDFVREASMRCDYLLATLNPDDPSLPVYKEYINCSRPLPEWKQDTPKEILAELKEEPKPGWVHWFFSFRDNISLTKEKLDRIIRNVPVGTKLYKNKILGLRGKATGLVFPNFSRSKHVKTKVWLKKQIENGTIKIKRCTAGLDTSYSTESKDTIAMVFQIITKCRKLITVDEAVFSNADLDSPVSPSDTVKNFIDFLEKNREEWGFARDVYIDSADAATITELNKHKRLHSSIYNFIPAYKKTMIIDRIKLQLSWIHQGAYMVLEHCVHHIAELETYSWDEKKINTPEDKNDHTINANQYGWLPYKMEIGDQEEQESEE
ncbi:MAG: terminase [Agathobacter sp.]